MGETCNCCGRTFDISQVVRAKDDTRCSECVGEEDDFRAETVQLSGHEMGRRIMALQERRDALEDALRDAGEALDMAREHVEHAYQRAIVESVVAKRSRQLSKVNHARETIRALLDAGDAREEQSDG